MMSTSFPVLLLHVVLLATLVSSSGPFKTLADIFQGELANLPHAPPGNPAAGGQDFFHCCLVAVNQSLEIVDGDLQFREGQTVLHGNVSTFLKNQFPCTASYDGGPGVEPQVTITYSWCNRNCGGWAKMSTKIESAWIKPLIGYILPTVVFCFSIPRRRSITIPLSLFPSSRLSRFPENLTLLYKLPASIFFMILDTLLWVVTCIVLSGPMLLSGFLEVLIDSRLLTYLSKNNQLGVRARAHLLLIALIGNLDEDPAWEHSKSIIDDLEDNSKIEGSSSNGQSQHQGSNFLPNGNFSTNFPGQLTTNVPTSIEAFKSRLVSLLESQSSFAISVGIGVVFYSSSFFYGILDIKKSYGDAGTSHSVAFGCFWMTIGHVAVIARVLLAGDNPSCWEAIAAHLGSRPPLPKDFKGNPRKRSSSIAQHVRTWSQASVQRRRLQLPTGFKEFIYQSGYSSKYRTAWMWNRGSRKALWIARLADEYDLPELQTEVLHMGWWEWIFATTIPTLLLYLVPAFLGGMTSYTTPIVGLSCRSMVPLTFAATQTILILLWLGDWRFWKRDPSMKVLTYQQLLNQRMQRFSGLEVFWYIFYVFSIIAATFFSIGGTTFQLMGLFGNCLCWIPMRTWKDRWSPKSILYLGDNSTEQIYYAKRFWIPIAVSATVFLIVTTYISWQYQHRIRRQYLDLVEGLGRKGHMNPKAEDVEESKPTENKQEKTEGLVQSEQV